MSEAKEITNIEHSQGRPLKSSDESNDNKPGGSRGTLAVRRRLPDERHSLTHHFSVGGQEGDVTIGLYADGLPGELFIRMGQEGAPVSGLLHSFATTVSAAVEYSVPVRC